MKKYVSFFAAIALLILLSPILCRKYTVPLVSNGKVIAVAKRPFVWPSKDNEFGVYVGKSKIFSLWGDFADSPVLIYPFADGKRFLCIDDDDTSVLVFVVDLGSSIQVSTNSSLWPPNDYLRTYMAGRMTNVMIMNTGRVRLPTYAEVQETSSNLRALTEAELRARSFPSGDFGIYRFYWSKAELLSEVATNRQSVWP